MTAHLPTLRLIDDQGRELLLTPTGYGRGDHVPTYSLTIVDVGAALAARVYLLPGQAAQLVEALTDVEGRRLP